MISADEIKVYCRFNINKVVDLHMEVEEGKHGRITLRGFLSKIDEITTLKEEDIKVTIKFNKEEQTLFQGIIQSLHTFVENGVAQVIVSATTYDIKLDQKEHSRSYQNSSETYLKLMQKTVAGYQGKILCDSPAVKINYPMIQYKETDWEFCKRMAAGMGLGVFCSPTCSFPQLQIGMVKNAETVSFKTQQYKVCVDESYYRAENNNGEKKEFLYYQVESEYSYEIGSGGFYQGQKRYIFEKTAELVNNVLVFRYKLGGKYRFSKAKCYNEKLAGVSLRGRIEKTEKQSVYIKLDIDGQDAEATYAYPWIPVTGNLMYCMPQIGTMAYLYFSDSDERSAKAINSIHTDFSIVSDPQKRSFVTEHGKQMQLYPDSIVFLTQREMACQSYRMGKEGLDFYADTGKIKLTGRQKIIFYAPEITVCAAQRIGQYKMEDYAAQKACEIYPKGSNNPATGGDGVYEQESSVNALAAQGVLWGSVYEDYVAFDDEIEYEVEKDGCPAWLKQVLGYATALVVGLAVAALVIGTGGFGLVAVGSVAAFALGATAGAITLGAGMAAVDATIRRDAANGTESSLGEYVLNSLTASVSVGGALITMMLAPQAALGGALLAGKMGLGFGMLGGFEIAAGIITSANLFFQMNDVRLFYVGEKDLRAPTGNELYDDVKKYTEIGSALIAILGLGTYCFGIYSANGGAGSIAEAAGYQNVANEGVKVSSNINMQKIYEHVFSQDHIKNGIFALGQSKDEIINKFFNIVEAVSNKLVEGPNEIRTIINGIEVTIRVYVQDGEIINLDGFVGYSQRILGNLINYIFK